MAANREYAAADDGILRFRIVSVVQGRDEQIIPPLSQFFARGVDQYPQIGVIQGNGARSRFLGQGGDAYGHAKRNHKQERRKAMNAHDVRYLLWVMGPNARISLPDYPQLHYSIVGVDM